MKPVYINGIGINGSLEKASDLIPRSKLRRCPDYVKVAAQAAAQALSEAQLPAEVDKNRVGSVLATNFGPVEANISFTDEIYRDGAGVCSPTTFSFTVANSCGGQIAIINGFRGASTMLMGSNPLEYAQLLLNANKADYLISGCVEECNGELIAGLKKYGQLQHLAEEPQAVMLLLGPCRNEHSYGALIGTAAVALSAAPYIRECRAEDSQAIAELLKELTSQYKPDLVLTAANDSGFDAIEQAGIKASLGAIETVNTKAEWGETLGCGFLLNVALAARQLRDNGDIKTVVATGIDAAGNYIAGLLVKA